MKKLTCLLALALLLQLCGCSVFHEHNWKVADCEHPIVCSGCGETQGEPLGHSFANATCTTARTCAACGVVDGEPLGHTWQDATCTSPATCTRCQKTEGSVLDHRWTEATCTSGKHCVYCYKLESDPLGHDVQAWMVTEKATCSRAGSQLGVCNRCGEGLKEVISLLDHTPGDWVVTKQPGRNGTGRRELPCTVCGRQVKWEDFTVSAQEAKSLYKKACKSYSYSEIARNPNGHKGELAKFSGKVIQVIQQDYGESLYYILRVGIKNGYSYYKDIIFVEYIAPEQEGRILEGDMITMYGELYGEKTYESTFGSSITLPHFWAEYIDIK